MPSGRNSPVGSLVGDEVCPHTPITTATAEKEGNSPTDNKTENQLPTHPENTQLARKGRMSSKEGDAALACQGCSDCQVFTEGETFPCTHSQPEAYLLDNLGRQGPFCGCWFSRQAGGRHPPTLTPQKLCLVSSVFASKVREDGGSCTFCALGLRLRMLGGGGDACFLPLDGRLTRRKSRRGGHNHCSNCRIGCLEPIVRVDHFAFRLPVRGSPHLQQIRRPGG